jgi:hypothetical protein
MKAARRQHLIAAALVCVLAFTATITQAADDPLPSWNDGKANMATTSWLLASFGEVESIEGVENDSCKIPDGSLNTLANIGLSSGQYVGYSVSNFQHEC